MSIRFETALTSINSMNIIRIPPQASEKLPSRGMVMIEGTVNKIPFTAPLEPDGKGSHWFEVSEELMVKAKLTLGATASLNIESLDLWPDPVITKDIRDAITASGLTDRWQSLTAKARWDWLRWIRATKNPATRQKRIAVACSKLQAGDNNPCCFDRTRCTIPQAAKSGVLLDS